mmetsp:Transcript_22351/g.28917  ORF Transcript_22351/g.28917 Transcript_22351/m.28917 type:complete len:731 (-) Transcript_22351:2122-4314(-)|eukprot:CAMPEP_0197285294 /NCGR_PEP_ID=MMETSP0890-20130614/512_1 /TAXON_ID=44058 ORGANISM="Aureoumbra lagunensis, Strain CCMP1510" /NCGR_SAMPLE_ID=MMETSP0890 /ASSEMBLY_ACC=CAM_ASM_000533 /LENGTH=730 /DNA_ID=CAMNT_0042752643 /DNA_START=34 /DNA_END=2226 /DNA_ORIENTATION=-
MDTEDSLVKVIRIRLVEEDGNEKSRLVTFWAGAEVNEMREVISAAFGLSWKDSDASTPVALVGHKTGLVIPLSVACRYPKTLDDDLYGILRLDGQGAEEYGDGDNDGDDEEMKVKNLIVLISRFARLLESTGRMTPEEAKTAINLASKRDTVVLTAYAVAATEQNADHLAALLIKVCRDYMMTKNADDSNSFDGATEHAVAEQLLRVIDELFVNPNYDLDFERCRYLQRLVLTKEPVVFAALDVFAQDNDLEELFDTLLRVANRATRVASDTKQEEDKESEQITCPAPAHKIDDDTEALAAQAEELIEERRFAVFRECISWLVDKEIIHTDEGKLLLDAITTGNEQLRKAFETYAETTDLKLFLQALTAIAKDISSAPAQNTLKPDSQVPPDLEANIAILVECVAWLREKDILEPVHATALMAAAKVNDPRLREALQLYTDSKNLGRLLENLSILARLLVDNAGATLLAQDRAELQQDVHNNDDAFWEQNDEDNTKSDPPPNDPTSNEAQATRQLEVSDELSREEDSVAIDMLSQVLSNLVKDNMLSDIEHDSILDLLKRRDARLLAAYDAYVDSNDIDDLLDTLLRLAKICANTNDDDYQSGRRHPYNNEESDSAQLEKAVRHLPDTGGRAFSSDDDEIKNKNDNDMSSKETTVDINELISEASTSDSFRQLVTSILTDVEAAAIEVSAARKDPELEDAIMRYQNDPNEQILSRDLKRIAGSTIKEIVK